MTTSSTNPETPITFTSQEVAKQVLSHPLTKEALDSGVILGFLALTIILVDRLTKLIEAVKSR